jgi:hypothetical protein
MTFVSLTEATTALRIDAKTLHRWLADENLCLQTHPGDGRKKGLSQQQLEQLALLHQRLLPASAHPAPLPAALPSLPTELLALPEQVAALQAQIATLQQQVVALTHLLQPPPPVSDPAAAATKPHPSAQHSIKKPTPAASRVRPAANTPRKSTHVIPRVEYGQDGRYVVICPKKGRLPFEPDSPQWFAWVATQESFRFVGRLGHFTARHEWYTPRGAWRAHRHIRNHVHIQRLAPNQELTIAVLEQAAQALQALLTTP